MSESYLGENTKKLGFGLMRLPKQGDDFDLEQVKAMVDAFMEAGFTYFDTAWAYEGSEEVMRKALIERYPRESFTVATKLAAWIDCKTREDAIAQFETSLKRSGAGYFDYYLLHNMGEARTKVFEDFGLWDFVMQKKKEGKIRHVGFSFHASADQLEEILKAHPEAEVVQLQINYADWEDPEVQSRKIYEAARKYNKPIIIMEPVKGGLLAEPPKSVAEIFRQADSSASYSSWAIRFAASLDGVITVLSGMSSLEQMQDNLSYMKDFRKLSQEEQDVIVKAREALAKIPVIPCTKCDYCAKVCPSDIGISGTFVSLNIMLQYDNQARAIHNEKFAVTAAGKKRANKCIDCGQCEEACPQHIPIREYLRKAVRDLHIEEVKS